jgi:predicted esterase
MTNRFLSLTTLALLLFMFAACDSSSDDGQRVGARDTSGGGADVSADAAAPVDDTTPGDDASIPDEDGIDPVDVVAPDVDPSDVQPPQDTTPPEDTTPQDTTPPQDTGPVDPKCQALTQGQNTLNVAGKDRTFLLALPTGAEGGGPWPVVFNWHGFGDSAANMEWMLSGQVNTPGFAFILVTPEDTNLQPPSGMDWDMLTVNDPNQELAMYDEIMACLAQKYGVDTERVHSVGFSAGAIMSDLIGVARGDQLASVVSLSGTYFSNPGNVDALGMLASFVSWPAMSHSNAYAQLLAHGSAADNYSLMVTTLQFDDNGRRDVTYLNERGHDVVHCDHGLGHTVPGELQGPALVEFLKVHVRGAPSPLVTDGLPAILPSYCQMKPGS